MNTPHLESEPMLFVDLRQGWNVQGRVIAVLPALLPVEEAEMRRYYALQPHDPRYFHLARPAKYLRLVVRRSSGRLVILPLNPDVYMETCK